MNTHSTERMSAIKGQQYTFHKIMQDWSTCLWLTMVYLLVII